MRPAPSSTLSQVFAVGGQPPDLLPDLHAEALAAVGAARAAVLQRAPRSGDYAPLAGNSSGNEPTGAWLKGAEADALDTLAAGSPSLSELADLPSLREKLAARRALIVPVNLVRDGVVLVIADPTVDDGVALEFAGRARVEFALALELARRGREATFLQRLRELSLVFSRDLSATLSLGNALEAVSREVNMLLGTRRTSVWLHDRRSRELTLSASSDPAHPDRDARVPADGRSQSARGLRLDGPQLLDEVGEPVLIAPLRGWRRALGTLVVEGAAAAELDDGQLVEVAQEIGRLLSVGIENVQLLDEILRQRRLLEDTFNSLIDLVVVVDNALKVVQMNDAFAARVGEPRTALLGRALDSLIGPELAAWAGAESHDTGGTAGDVRTRQVDDARLGGTFAATVTALINQEREPVGRVLVVRDITLQARLQAEQDALRARLGQSEKLASLGQFVAGIAHEMNNPLQGVLGHLELLIQTPDAERPFRADHRRLYQDADRAAKIVRNLLVFTGSHRMQRRRLRIDRIVSRALASRRGALKRLKIAVVRHETDDRTSVNGDALLLQQAFLNILINAEHATVAGERPRRIDITTNRDAAVGTVRITIRDSGPGIPADVLPRVFDPFFTTKDVGQGMGLGLAITYGIVQEHGGSIEATNTADGGAIFIVDLPEGLPV
jgi:PAS domain S-box-containing protein